MGYTRLNIQLEGQSPNRSTLGRKRQPKTLTLARLRRAARYALQLSKTLTWDKTREGWLHGVILGLLEREVGNMQSEYSVRDGRIDFRHGGNNPDCVELVVRRHGNEHYGGQNESELWKLCRIPFEKARKRILLILDASELAPTPKENLAESYKSVSGGAGRFSRNEVTVLYVHPEIEYAFRWNP